MDERGEMFRSAALAHKVAGYHRDNVQGLAFLVGEAEGLAREDLSAAHERWSLSHLTLPHQLCFVILAEQLYRATTINRGGSYHRD